jgi:hypothetical protein
MTMTLQGPKKSFSPIAIMTLWSQILGESEMMFKIKTTMHEAMMRTNLTVSTLIQHSLAVEVAFAGLYLVGGDEDTTLKEEVLPVFWEKVKDPTSHALQPTMSQEKWIDEWLPSRRT